jgi:tetratricopeptide (TPR) repeat protein
MKFSYIFLLMVITTGSRSQERVNDSLQSLLIHSKEDTVRIKLLFQLADLTTGKSNSQKKLSYLQEAKSLSQKINNKRFLSRSLNKIGYAYFEVRNDSAAMKNYLPALQISRDLRDLDACGEITMNIGGLYDNHSDYAKTLEYYTKALKLWRESGNKGHIAFCLRNTGSVLYFNGQYSLALDYFIEASKLWEETGNKRGISTSHTFIGMVYYSMGLYQKALDHYEIALRVGKEINYREAISSTLNDMANVYSRQGYYDKSLEYNLQALQIMRETESEDWIGMTNIDIGNNFMAQKLYSKALSHYQEALSIYLKLQNPGSVSNAYLCIGKAYSTMNEDAKGFEYYQKALSLVNPIEKPIVAQCYQCMAQYFAKTKQYKKAYDYFHLYAIQQNLQFNENITKQMVATDAKYENEKRDNQLKLLTKKKAVLAQLSEINQLQLRNKLFMAAGAGALILCLFVVVILVLRQISLQIRNRKIELNQKLIRAQICPDFIYHSLIAIKNYQTSLTIRESSNYIYCFAKLMRYVLENSSNDFVPLENDLITLKYYVELQQLRFRNNFDYRFEVDPAIEADFISIPPLLSQPFIENIIERWNTAAPTMRCNTTIRYKQVEGGLQIELEISTKENEPLESNQHAAVRIKDLFLTARKITEERLQILNRKAAQKITFAIQELQHEADALIVSKITFTVPETI